MLAGPHGQHPPPLRRRRTKQLRLPLPLNSAGQGRGGAGHGRSRCPQEACASPPALLLPGKAGPGVTGQAGQARRCRERAIWAAAGGQPAPAGQVCCKIRQFAVPLYALGRRRPVSTTDRLGGAGSVSACVGCCGDHSRARVAGEREGCSARSAASLLTCRRHGAAGAAPPALPCGVSGGAHATLAVGRGAWRTGQP